MKSRRSFLKSVAIGSTMTAFGTASCSRQQKPPNVVLIVADDLGWSDVGYHGQRVMETPNIDALSKESVVFSDAYANAPNCAPSRASLLTGQYTPRHGIFTVAPAARGKSEDRKLIVPETATELPLEANTIAEILGTAGYNCAHIGKWHLGNPGKAGPQEQGFSHNIAGNRAGHPKSYFSPYQNPDLEDGPSGEYLTDRLTEEAIDFIEDNLEKPFFLYLPYYSVHTPISAKAETVDYLNQEYGDAMKLKPEYAAMVKSVDQGVGAILSTIAKNDLRDNTVIVFMSDNGGHGIHTDNAPLRGSKGMLYEGGIRVPMLISWPKRYNPQKTSQAVIATDLLPTIAEICKVQNFTQIDIDGESLVPLLNSIEMDERSIYWHFPAYLENYRGMEGLWRTSPAGAIRKGDWKLIEFFENGELELYNLATDICEQDNLILKYPEKAKELHQLLVQWRQEVNAPVPLELNPEYKNNE
jgi:arylsulfatase A-like enzyme